MQLARDVLDQQLIDRLGRKAGKIDGIALEIREGEPPRVAYLDIGTDVLARRLSHRLEQLLQWFRRLVGRRQPPPFQIPWSKVRNVDLTVEVDVDWAVEGPDDIERWLATNVIGRIPGSGKGKGERRENHR